MLSRVAEAVYWLNRYVERAENVARFVDVNLNLTLDVGEETGHWDALVETTGDLDAYTRKYGPPTRDHVLRFLTFDQENPNSILTCLAKARENARSVREIISSEMWEHVNRSYLHVLEAAPHDHDLRSGQELFARVKTDSHLFVGLAAATMSHGEAWHFGELGRFLERADKTARMLDVKYYILLPTPRDIGSPLDELQWSAVLRSASALEMYRKKRRRRVTPWDVVDFLLLDREFPRSVRHGVNQAEEALHAITGTPRGAFGNDAEKLLGRLRSDLDFMDSKDVFTRGLHELLQEFQTRLNRIGDAVHRTFFAIRPLDATPTP